MGTLLRKSAMKWWEPERASSAASERTARIDPRRVEVFEHRQSKLIFADPRQWILPGGVRTFPVYRTIKLVKVLRVPGAQL